MKYNSIGEQLIAKAKEIDPNYKPDKFNDMSEALDVILNNTGGGGKSVPPTLNLINLETGEVRTTITEEEYNNLENGLYNQVIYDSEAALISAYSPSKLISIGGDYSFTQFRISTNEDETVSYSSMVLNSITIGEKNTSNEYPITVTEEATINPPIPIVEGTTAELTEEEQSMGATAKWSIPTAQSNSFIFHTDNGGWYFMSCLQEMYVCDFIVPGELSLILFGTGTSIYLIKNTTLTNAIPYCAIKDFDEGDHDDDSFVMPTGDVVVFTDKNGKSLIGTKKIENGVISYTCYEIGRASCRERV